MAPTRRSLLATIGSASVIGLAGCLGSSGDDVGGPGTDSPTLSPTDNHTATEDWAETGTDTGTDTPTETGTDDGSDSGTETPTPADEPRFEELGFESKSGTCGQSSSAEITRSDRTITVEGTVLTSTPCYTANLESSTVDQTSASFVVTAEEQDVDACQQCLGEIPFSITATIGGPMPDEVVVEIKGNDDRTFRKDI